MVTNYATYAPGYVQVEIQGGGGTPIPGYKLQEADKIVSDEIERVVSRQGKTDVSALAGQPVRLRFAMKAEDLYSIRFRQ